MDITNINVNQNISSNISNSDNVPKVNVKTNDNNGNTEDKKDRKVSEKEINSAVNTANSLLNDSTHLQFKVHKITGDIMVKIIDDKTGEVIKEIPPEKIIDMIANICETLGIFVNEKR